MINTGITDRELEELLRMYEEDPMKTLKRIKSDNIESDKTEPKQEDPNAEHEKL